MSIVARFYAIPRARFDALWACRDEALLKKVLERSQRHVEHDGGMAIAQILVGGTAAKPYELGSAVEAICRVAGEYLGDLYSNDEYRVAQLFEKAGLGGALLMNDLSEKWPFPIPDTGIEGPFIALFSRDEVAQTLAKLKRLSPCGDHMMDQALEWALRVYGDAVAKDTDLVVFQN